MEQINLNRPEIWPRRVPFPARAMATGLLIVVAALVLGYGYLARQAAGQRAELEEVRRERDRAQKRLESLTERHQANRSELDVLRDRVDELQSRIGSLRRARRALGTRLKAAGGKAELVRSLGRARAKQDGVWLTRFRLQGPADVVLRLEGRSLRPEAVPRYLEAITAQEPYRKGFFEDFQAEIPEGDSRDGEDEVLEFHTEARFPLAGNGSEP